MKKIFIYILISCLFFDVYSQRRKNNKNVNPTTTKEEKISLSALKLRNVGPAFLSGRISDIAIHPKNDNIWYVATGSSGVWKTENSGTTWKPIFDREVLILIASSGNGILISSLLLNPPSAEAKSTEYELPLTNASVNPSAISSSDSCTSVFMNPSAFSETFLSKLICEKQIKEDADNKSINNNFIEKIFMLK